MRRLAAALKRKSTNGVVLARRVLTTFGDGTINIFKARKAPDESGAASARPHDGVPPMSLASRPTSRLEAEAGDAPGTPTPAELAGAGERRRPGAGAHAPVATDVGAHLLAAFHQAPVAMAVTCADGRFLEVNDALCEMVGHSPDDLLAQHVDVLVHLDDREAVTRGRQHMIDTGQRRHNGRFRLVRSDGRTVVVSLTCALLSMQGRATDGIVFHAVDITADQLAQARLRHQALHDPLTGLPNRVLLLDRLTHALSRLERGSCAVAVLFVDLDGFKAVNDRFGHGAGDQTLVEVTTRIRAALRPGDTAARLGGDEFVIVCENTDALQAQDVADRLTQVCARPVTTDAGRVDVSATVGLAVATTAGTTAEQLVHAADTAMYKAKLLARP